MRTAKNNFDVLRLSGALFVAVSHTSYLNRIRLAFKGNQGLQSFGGIGLSLFCVISGYLVTQSRDRNTVRNFAIGRPLRIFPALFVAIPLMAFVFGPFLTTLSIGGYFSSGGTWRFLGRMLVFPLNPCFQEFLAVTGPLVTYIR